jgi:hypothetical protein
LAVAIAVLAASAAKTLPRLSSGDVAEATARRAPISRRA